MAQQIYLPPAVEHMLDVYFKSDDVESFKEYFNNIGSLGELRDLCRISKTEYQYYDRANHNGIDSSIVTAASWNPFSDKYKCGNYKCRMNYIDQLMVMSTLYADCTCVPDEITVAISKIASEEDRGKKHNDSISELYLKLNLLEKSLPLFRNGIIRFGYPSLALCQDCLKKEVQKIVQASADLLQEWEMSVHFDVQTHGYKQVLLCKSDLDINNGCSHSTVLLVCDKDDERLKSISNIGDYFKQKALNFFLEPTINDNIKLIGEASLSYRSSSTLMLSSPREAMSLQLLDGNKMQDCMERKRWEALRSVDMPWVNKLNAIELLELKDGASKALPNFKQFMFNKVKDESITNLTDLKKVMSELQAQANDVASELGQFGKNNEKRYQTGMGALALTFVMYGLYSHSSPVIATSLASLLATLAHLRNAERETDSKTCFQASKPGYVLVKAKDIVSHR